MAESLKLPPSQKLNLDVGKKKTLRDRGHRDMQEPNKRQLRARGPRLIIHCIPIYMPIFYLVIRLGTKYKCMRYSIQSGGCGCRNVFSSGVVFLLYVMKFISVHSDLAKGLHVLGLPHSERAGDSRHVIQYQPSYNQLWKDRSWGGGVNKSLFSS